MNTIKGFLLFKSHMQNMNFYMDKTLDLMDGTEVNINYHVHVPQARHKLLIEKITTTEEKYVILITYEHLNILFKLRFWK